ncbi:MAG: hypothetical protein ACRYGI_06350 [Janthinobacterium lividum]
MPVELDLPENEAVIMQDGDRPIVEQVRKKGLTALLDSWKPFDGELPENDDPPPAPRNVF